MSRYYRMDLDICNYNPKKEKAIKEAADFEWNWDDWYTHEDKEGLHLTSGGEGNLAGGETEGEFVERLRRAIWRANGAYCGISVVATCLEDLPHELYCTSEEDYEDDMAEGRLQPAKKVVAEKKAGKRTKIEKTKR